MVEYDWEITNNISAVPGKCGSVSLLCHTDGEILPHRAGPRLKEYFFWSIETSKCCWTSYPERLLFQGIRGKTRGKEIRVWPCFEEPGLCEVSLPMAGVGTRWPLRSLPTQTLMTLWFYTTCWSSPMECRRNPSFLRSSVIVQVRDA